MRVHSRHTAPWMLAASCLLGLVPAMMTVSAQAASAPSWHVDAGLPTAGLTLSNFACAPNERCVGLGSLKGREIAVTLRSDKIRSWGYVTSTSYPTGPFSCATPAVCEGIGKSSGDSTPILRSTDAGRSWRSQVDVEGVADGVACPTAARCIALDLKEGAASFLSLAYSTSDGGSTWQHRTIWTGTVGFASVLCPSAAVCYASPGDLGLGMDILITRNFGSTWTKLAVPWPSHAEFTALSCASVSSCGALVTVMKSMTVEEEKVVWIKSEGTSFSSTSVISGAIVQEFGFSCGTAAICHLDVDSSPDASAALSFKDLETADAGQRWAKTQVPPSVEGLFGIACEGPTCLAIGKRSSIDSFVRFAAS